MKERPILFKGEMVRAILAGTKTQTRRLVKPQPSAGFDWCRVNRVGPWFHVEADHPQTVMHTVTCKQGVVGDRLWVKETHRFPSKENPRVRVEYRADMSSWGIADSYNVAKDEFTRDAKLFPGRANEYSKQRWRPSIFMQRWASRLTLEITDVRVERLNAISAADAIAEGIEKGSNPAYPNDYKYYGELEQLGQITANPVWSYQSLWESINGAGSWAANPWVWVISFRRFTP